MRRMIDLTGRKFGKLTVTGFAETRNTQAYFNCVCECGNTCVVRGGSLKSGDTFSCGCIRRETLATLGSRTKNHWVIDGVEYSRVEFCKVFEISSMTLSRRLRDGMSIEEIAEVQKKKIEAKKMI